MPGPIVHTKAMSLLTKILNSDGIPCTTGSWKDNMLTDLYLSPHGYSKETGEGSIFDKLSSLSKLINQSAGENYLNITFRHICHLCVDSMSIGQISNKLWGTKDNIFDFCGEFVWRKIDKYPNYAEQAESEVERLKAIRWYRRTIKLHSKSVPQSIDDLITLQKDYICYTYNCYFDNASKPNFVLTRYFRIMVRRSILFGHQFAYMWIKLSLKK